MHRRDSPKRAGLPGKDRPRCPKNIHPITNCHRPCMSFEPSIRAANSRQPGTPYSQAPPTRWEVDCKRFRAVEIELRIGHDLVESTAYFQNIPADASNAPSHGKCVDPDPHDSFRPITIISLANRGQSQAAISNATPCKGRLNFFLRSNISCRVSAPCRNARDSPIT